MKLVVLSFSLLAVVGCNNISNGDEFLTRIKLREIEGYLKKKHAISDLTAKIEDLCPSSKTKLENAMNQLKICSNQIDETKETACYIAQNRAPKCLEPVMKVVRECMPAGAKEIPDFMLGALLKTVGYICKTDGEHIFELGNSCVYRNAPALEVCKHKLVSKMQTYQKNGFGIEDICSLMDHLRPCLNSHISLSCGSPVTKEAFAGVFDALMYNCKNIADPSSNEIK